MQNAKDLPWYDVQREVQNAHSGSPSPECTKDGKITDIVNHQMYQKCRQKLMKICTCLTHLPYKIERNATRNAFPFIVSKMMYGHDCPVSTTIIEDIYLQDSIRRCTRVQRAQPAREDPECNARATRAHAQRSTIGNASPSFMYRQAGRYMFVLIDLQFRED